MLREVTEDEFRQSVNEGLVLADFFSSTCGPCKMLGPVIDQLAQEYEGKAVIGKVNVDEEQELAMRYGVMSIPTVIFFKDGEEVTRQVGLLPPAAFTSILEENL